MNSAPAAQAARRNRLGFWLVLCLIAFAFGIAAVNVGMIAGARSAICPRLEALPERQVAVVLGTAPFAGRSHYPNPFFTGRMDAAARLYHTGKAKHLLVTGDNGRRTYDETSAMRDALRARGVPMSAMTLDYAGFRTLDSMARARAVFGLRRCTLVTDDFHLARTIFLARAFGLEPTGFASASVPYRWSTKARMREISARCRAFLDVYLLHTRPKFYGPPVSISAHG